MVSSSVAARHRASRVAPGRRRNARRRSRRTSALRPITLVWASEGSETPPRIAHAGSLGTLCDRRRTLLLDRAGVPAHLGSKALSALPSFCSSPCTSAAMHSAGLLAALTALASVALAVPAPTCTGRRYLDVCVSLYLCSARGGGAVRSHDSSCSVRHLQDLSHQLLRMYERHRPHLLVRFFLSPCQACQAVDIPLLAVLEATS